MYPVNDIICTLLETQFARWKDDDKKDVLTVGRPTDLLSICARKEIIKTGKSYTLKFKKTWFTDYTWLCSSQVLQKLFCWPCLLFGIRKTVWNKGGFVDLLNVTRALHKHADSAEHMKCQLKFKTYATNLGTIADALQENSRLYIVNFNENVRLNRLVLRILIDAVLYLTKQELAFSSHDESNGNIKELFTLLLSTSPLEVQNAYEKIKNEFSSDSDTIENELIDCISEYINDYVKNEITESNFFSAQIDDITDINQTSQCSIIIRCVNSNGLLVERFLGFHDVGADRSCESLYNLLDSILGQFHYEHKLIGQCYDGASVKSGQLNELQKKINDKAPQAIFIHCLTHRLNHILQQSFAKISKCRIFFASISGIPSFFHHSAKRTYVINSTSTTHMPAVTTTRWSSNSKLLGVIVEDWDKLKAVFEWIINDEQSDQKSVQLSKGFLNDMNNFEFTFLAVVFNDVFSLTDVLFCILQDNSLDINYCISEIKSTCDLLKNKRNDKYFSTIFEKTTQNTKITSKQDEIYQNYKVLFYEILDHILIEMNTRFQDCENLQFVCLVDNTKFQQYTSCFPSDVFENLQQYFDQIFVSPLRLKNELGLLYADEVYRNVSTEKLLQLINDKKDVFREAYKLFSLILTIPSTSASVERGSSCLKRIKTYTRNTIFQKKLSSLANISIQKELLLDLIKTQPFYEDIADKFAAMHNRKIDLIYKK